MNKRAFQQLLQRYASGECSVEESQLVEQWFNAIEQDHSLSLTDREKDVLENELLERIQAQTQPTGQLFINRWFRRSERYIKLYTTMAATVLLVLSFGGYIWFGLSQKQVHQSLSVFKPGVELITQTNKSDKVETITLPDGSQVILMPKSSLAYPKYFTSAKREIKLDGDAFFDVVKNPKKPFLVYCGEVVTYVLGTSFWVTTQDRNKAIQVEVKTGRVFVYALKELTSPSLLNKRKKDESRVVLTPNQKVTFLANEQSFEPGLVDNPLVINPPESKTQLIYDEIPLPEVLKDLEKIYGIDLVIANDTMKACTVLGDLTNMSLHQQLDLICKAIKATYQVKGTQIVIMGEGCQ